MSSRQKGQNERRHNQLSSCSCRVETVGDRCQHWNEEIKKENRDEQMSERYAGVGEFKMKQRHAIL